MNPYQETFDTWNKVAQLYEDKFMHLTIYNESYDFVCKHLQHLNSKLLEVGCGPGNITKYLLTQKPDFDILGIDIAPNMIQLAEQNNPTATFKVLDALKIHELNDLFDAIIVGFCLPYFAPMDAEHFIKNAYSALNKKGVLYLSFVEGNPINSGYQTASSGDRTYFYYYHLNDLEKLLSSNQFKLLKTFHVEYEKSNNEKEIHTVLIAEKL
ncbi:MAG: class I SAM-dependent methyltransferase [Chitinophagaceae bacterium]|jgi:ubiquinone/menaquinone biosynthesis C-methylase UbiE|nr:class I SAM-dependent methyltransferase [Chitinophagaceae bacterium]MBP9739172.1 class I SAM-dependent methyltransferase [Chitinophagaceae bacterium]